MFYTELKRLLKHKTFLLLIGMFMLLSVLQNVMILNREDVKQLNNDLLTINDIDFSQYDSAWQQAEYLGYSEEGASRANLNQKYITNVDEQIENIQSRLNSVLFSSEENQTELKYQLEMYQSLKEYTPSIMNDVIFSDCSNNVVYWNFFYLFIGFFIIYLLIQQDKDSSLLPLYGSTVTSMKSIILSKIFVMILVLLSLFLFKTIIDMSTFLFCGLNLSAPIQHLYNYDVTSFTLSIGNYYLLLTGSMLITVFVILFLFICLYCLFQNTSISFVVIVVFMIIELLAYNYVSIASSFMIFKEINLWAVLVSTKLIDQLIYIIGNVVPQSYCLLGLFIAVVLLLIFADVYLYQNLFHKKTHIFRKFTLRSKHVSIYQWKDILISSKGLLIVFGILIYCVVNVSNYTVIKSTSEASYEAFAQQYYGEINDDLIQKIKEDKLEILIASNRTDELVQKINDGEELSEEEAKELSEIEILRSHKDDIQRIEDEVNALNEVGSQYFSDNSSLELLVEKKNETGLLLKWLLVFIPIIVIVFSTMVPFYQTKTSSLFFSTYVGERKYLMKQWIHFFIVGMILMFIVYGSHMYKITTNYAYTFVDMPINQAFGVSSNIRLLTWFILSCVNELLVLSIVISGSMYLSRKMGMIVGIVTMSSILFVLLLCPIGLAMILRYDYLNHLLWYVVICGMILFGDVLLLIQ
jgi:hypothetical protein